jgi:hypothetical protein
MAGAGVCANALTLPAANGAVSKNAAATHVAKFFTLKMPLRRQDCGPTATKPQTRHPAGVNDISEPRKEKEY